MKLFLIFFFSLVLSSSVQAEATTPPIVPANTINVASVPQTTKPNEVDMASFLSKEKTQGTKIYTVQKGDSLYKIAQKNHTTIDLIKKVNALKKDMIYPNMKLKVLDGKFDLEVDKSENTLTVNLNNKTWKRYSVATGAENSTPVGEFKIKTKLEDPIWYKTGAVIPAESPENSLGTRWLGFDYPGYGIHGTIEPQSIGTQASAGCIRMHNADVEELYMLLPRGTVVRVVD